MLTIKSGMGTGIAQPAIFISLTSNLEKADIAVGASALFLVIGINVVSTITIFDALMKFLFRRALYRNLSGVDNAADVSILSHDRFTFSSRTNVAHRSSESL